VDTPATSIPCGDRSSARSATVRASRRIRRIRIDCTSGERLFLARRDDRAIDPPAPMVRGAVQITTHGTPIVLGPDHPVTGGYPVLAVVTRASQSMLARLRAKRRIRFALFDAVL
jgi:allophanate hydrolase subunit 2